MQVSYHIGQVVFRGSIDPKVQWQMHLEQFRAARDAGFDICSWAHHYIIDPFQHFQPLPVLARFAAESGDMKLATSVLLLPLLNPVDVAEQVATLDHICQGRLILGLGLGYRPEECEAFGTRMSERAARFTEALELMKRLWTEEEVTHHGRFYHVSGARPTARPYQQPYPKLWLGAMSDPAVRRVGRSGEILYAGPFQTIPMLQRQIALYHRTLQGNGHPIPEEMAVVKEFFTARTRAEAVEKVGWGLQKKLETYATQGIYGTDPEMNQRSAGGDLEALIDDPFIIGSPEECVEKIARYRELGFTHIGLRLFYPDMPQKDVLEHIELTGSQILPEVHKL